MTHQISTTPKLLQLEAFGLATRPLYIAHTQYVRRKEDDLGTTTRVTFKRG